MGSDLKSADGWAIGEVAVAARGDEAAVVYVERSADGAASRVRLQRLNASGTFFGESLELANGLPYGLQSVAIASNGETYLVCWAGTGEVNCSALGEAQQPTPAFHAQGKAVAVVHGGRTWLVAYVTDPLVAPAKLVLQRLGEDFEPLPGPTWTVAREISGSFAVPLLASSDSEFLVVANDPAQGNRAQLHRLDRELNRVAGPVDLGRSIWSSGSVAGNAKLVAVSLSEPYGSNLMMIDGGGLVQSVGIPGGFKLGMHQALLADDSRVVASWFTTEPRLHTQGFVNGSETPVLPLGTPANEQTPTQSTSTSSKLMLVRASDRVLAVYPTFPEGPALGETWNAEGIAVRPLSTR